MRGTLVEMQDHVSIAQRVWGFFHFVNIMWLLAIFGIVVSIGPAIW